MSYAKLKSDDGYMLDPGTWTEGYAGWRATDMDLELTPPHWNIINMFREFIADKAVTPSSRVAQKEAKKRFGIDSRGFYGLFPSGPRQVAMLAGGIKPSGC